MAKRYRKTKPALNDWHLWSEVTRSVSPLRPQKMDAVFEETQSGPRTKQSALMQEADLKVWSPTATPIHHSPVKSSKPQTRPAKIIEPRIRRRLMRGQLPIDATIDLHGLRQAEAHAALCRFVAARYASGARTILVITGKGLKKTGYGAIEQRGVLRTMLPRWLSEPALAPMIAGWEVSAQTHGGEGAYYVRLRRADK